MGALLKRHARINAKDKTGLTALHYAAAHLRKPMITLLLDNGADPLAVTGDDVTAEQIVRRTAAAIAEHIAQHPATIARKKAYTKLGETFRSGAGKTIAAPERATFVRKNRAAVLKLP